MTKEAIINKAVKTLNSLPADKFEEVADFADYILKKHEEGLLQEGMQKLIEQSTVFDFLLNEEDLYSLDDIKKEI